jgi:Tol biopolymer transport system component
VIDLRHELEQELDGVSRPDLWAEIESRAAAPERVGIAPLQVPSTRRRDRVVAVAIALVLVAAVIAFWATGALRRDRDRVPATEPTGRIVFLQEAPEAGTSGASGGFHPEYQLFAMNVDGTEVVQLTDLSAAFPAGIEGPEWSPDGSRIAFDGEADDGHTHIFAVNADGTGLTQITSGDGDEIDATWSPDGTQLAVERQRSPSEPTGIAIVDVATGELRMITENPIGGYDAFPAWSPDGTRIAFARSPGDQQYPSSAVFVVDVDGRGLQRVTPRGLNAYRPAWSPDGTQIIFNTNDTPERIQDAEIYIVASDGSGLRRLTHEENASAFRPTWSPDGEWILFTRFAFPGQLTKSFDIYVMRPDGTDLRPVTSTPDVAENAGDWRP